MTAPISQFYCPVFALHSGHPGTLTHSRKSSKTKIKNLKISSGQKQRDQHRNDGNHNQQFDECETATRVSGQRHFEPSNKQTMGNEQTEARPRSRPPATKPYCHPLLVFRSTLAAIRRRIRRATGLVPHPRNNRIPFADRLSVRSAENPDRVALRSRLQVFD